VNHKFQVVVFLSNQNPVTFVISCFIYQRRSGQHLKQYPVRVVSQFSIWLEHSNVRLLKVCCPGEKFLVMERSTLGSVGKHISWYGTALDKVSSAEISVLPLKPLHLWTTQQLCLVACLSVSQSVTENIEGGKRGVWNAGTGVAAGQV